MIGPTDTATRKQHQRSGYQYLSCPLLLLRLFSIFVIVTYHGLRFVVGVAASPLTSSRCKLDILIGILLSDICASLGGGFLKLGQLLSTRVDLLPNGMIAQLRRLQDDVRPMSNECAVSIIEKSFACPLWSVFSEFDLAPVASASIAQVHRARLLVTHEDVAVKIRRPDIERIFATDALLVSLGTQLLGYMPSLRNYPLSAAVAEVNEALVSQTDFVREGRNLARLRALVERPGEIRVPRVFLELCSPDVVVMEFVESLGCINDASIDNETKRSAVRFAISAIYRMIFEIKFFHCDPHPGNLLISRERTLVFLDAGLMAEFEVGQRRLFAEFFYSIAIQDARLATRICLETAISAPVDLDVTAFERDLASLLLSCAGKRALQFQIVSFVTRLFRIQSAHGIRPSPNFTLAILTLLGFEGIIKQIDPEMDFQRLAIPSLLAALVEAKDINVV